MAHGSMQEDEVKVLLWLLQAKGGFNQPSPTQTGHSSPQSHIVEAPRGLLSPENDPILASHLLGTFMTISRILIRHRPLLRDSQKSLVPLQRRDGRGGRGGGGPCHHSTFTTTTSR